MHKHQYVPFGSCFYPECFTGLLYREWNITLGVLAPHFYPLCCITIKPLNQRTPLLVIKYSGNSCLPSPVNVPELLTV